MSKIYIAVLVLGAVVARPAPASAVSGEVSLAAAFHDEPGEAGYPGLGSWWGLSGAAAFRLGRVAFVVDRGRYWDHYVVSPHGAVERREFTLTGQSKLFGFRYHVPTKRRAAPFAQLLVGSAFNEESVIAPGAGLDLGLGSGRHVAWRILTELELGLGGQTTTPRVTAGLVLHLGKF